MTISPKILCSRSVRCVDRSTQEVLEISFRLCDIAEKIDAKQLRMVQVHLEYSIGADVHRLDFDGFDKIHAMTHALLHVDTFILQLRARYDVVLENGMPFDQKCSPFYFGEIKSNELMLRSNGLLEADKSPK